MTPDEIVAAYEAELARLGIMHPEPPSSRRLVDLLLAPFGRDSQSFAQAERARLLAAAAALAICDRLSAEGLDRVAARAAVDAAVRRREAAAAPAG